MFIIREVQKSDLHELYNLAEVLKLSSKVYFYNLPHDKSLLDEKINLSIQSFSGKLKNPLNGEYIFVLVDTEKNKIIGTSMIVAQHGTPESPHQFFRVKKIKKHSKSLHIGFIHEILEYGYDTNGPTEIGGLVLHPDYRNSREKLGKQLSFVRFLYIAMHPTHFRDRILAELQPPLTPTGESPFWEALGRKFTNLTYEEADNLSRKNKEFIISLFPEGYIYTALLNTEARQAIGKINQQTKPVEHLLKKIGFKYLNMIDPFDGGPHYGTKISDISLIKNTKEFSHIMPSEKKNNHIGLIGTHSDEGFLAIQTELTCKDDKLLCPESVVSLMNQPKKIFVCNY